MRIAPEACSLPIRQLTGYQDAQCEVTAARLINELRCQINKTLFTAALHDAYMSQLLLRTIATSDMWRKVPHIAHEIHRSYAHSQ